MQFLILPPLALAMSPFLVGPLQVLLAFLPAILVAVLGAVLAFLKPASIRVSILLLAAAVAGLCYGLPKITQVYIRRPVAVRSGESAWPMFRGGLSRRGCSGDGAADPTSGGRIWSFATRFKASSASPAIVGNCVLTAVTEKNELGERGAIVCLDTANGNLLWEFSPSDFRATASSPVVAGRHVVCGEGLRPARDSRIFCLAFKTGRKLWELRTAGCVGSAPCISGDMVFCGAGEDGLYGLRLDPPSGTTPVVWHVTGRAGENYNCEAAVAAKDGCVYFSSAAIQEKDWSGIVCVSAATGRELWHVDTPLPVWGPPTLVDGLLLVGMGNGTLAESAEQVWERRQQEMSKNSARQATIEAAAPRFMPGGELWALDARTGKMRWKHKLRQTLSGAVAAAEGCLYFAARDGVLTCVTLENQLLAQWDMHEGIETSPAIGSNHVYVVTEGGRLCCLDRHTLLPVWQTRLGRGTVFASSPAIGNGHVYVGTPGNGLICLGRPSDQPPEPIFWPGARGGAGNSGCVDGSALPFKGAVAWRWPAAEQPGNTRVLPPAITPAVVLNGTLYASVCSVQRTGLVALKVGGSSSTKTPEAEKWFVTATYPLGDAVAATTSRVYFAEGPVGSAGRKLRCVDANTGGDVWQAPIDTEASGAFTLTATSLDLCSKPEELASIDIHGATAGRVRWSAPVGRTIGMPCSTKDLVLVATVRNGVVAVKAASGEIFWKQPEPLRAISGPVANEDMAVIVASNRLEGLSLVNGATLWTRPCLLSAAPLVADDERILCTQTNGEIMAIGWDGRELFRVKGAMPRFPAMLFGDNLLYCSQQGTLQKVDLSAQNPESRWLATAWLGAITTPPLLADGSIYFTTAEKGLVCARPGRE